MFNLELAPAGIVLTRWNEEARTNGKEVVRPTETRDILRFWHYNVQAIAPGYTLGDLIGLIRNLEDPGLLSPMLCCNVEAFMTESREAEEKEADTGLDYLFIHNYAWYNEESEFSDAPALGVINTQYGISRDISGWGAFTEPYEGYLEAHPEDPQRHMAYGISFSPLAALMPLPLRYESQVVFRDAKFGTEELFETTLPITFGELVQAIFWELGFFGSPSQRDAKSASLLEAVEHMDEVREEIEDAEKYLGPEALEAKKEELGLQALDPDEMLADIRRRHNAEPARLRQAKDVISRYGASLCKTPSVRGVILESKEEPNVIVLVTDPASVVDIPTTLDGVPIGCRVVDATAR